MRQPDDPGLDPLDDPDPFDPTGYYRRKEKHRAEMIPYLVGLWVVLGVIVFVRILIQENNMIVNIIIGVACLFVGWNVPQPLFAQKAENWVRAKLNLKPKTLREVAK